MTRTEVAAMLAACSALDGRVVTDDTVSAWHDVLGGLPLDRAVPAVREHYRTETRRLMPADVVRLARQAPSEREPTSGVWIACERSDCHCTHSAGCIAGWLDSDDGKTTRPCPNCRPGRGQDHHEDRGTWLSRLRRQREH